MAAAERESLFSLEVVVDEVSIPGITCRYPSVAVRLMDFPTLTINHADVRMIRKIQLNLQQRAEIPRQFIELLDEHDNFSFQKGKSCLFKFSAKNLRMHLSNTPLYILVIDTFPEIPKLIASCILPLCQSIDKLYEHITSVGLAVPETDGQRGEYVLRNLMGVNVGHIVFGYRLISLGEGLLQHIPQEALVVSKTEEERKQEQDRDPEMIPERDVPKPEILIPKPEMPTQKPEVQKLNRLSKLRKSRTEILDLTKVQHIFNESVMNLEFQNEGTQTDPPRRAVGVSTHEAEEERLYRPPPLYFNSQAEENIPKPIQQSYFGFDYVDERESIDDEAVSEVCHRVVEQSPRQFQLPRTGMQYADIQQNLAQFPVLRALFDELNRIQGSALQSSSSSAFQQVTPRAQPKPKVQRSPVKTQNVTVTGKENRDGFLSRMAQPKTRQEKFTARSPQEPLPKHKSWLRKEPVVGPKKTRLQYGMTNTQRLRLALNNPQMLRDIDDDKPKSHIAQRLLENLATLGNTRVLGDGNDRPLERPVPTPRKNPPVRHSHEFDHKEEDGFDEESSTTSPVGRSNPSHTTSVHVPVAELTESDRDLIESLPDKFPGFQEDDDIQIREPNVRDSLMKMPVINPKASKNSPISSLRNSQAFTSRSELEHPSARARPSLENIRSRAAIKAMKSVSFDGDDTNTKVSSEYEPSRGPKHGPQVTMETESLSSYTPTEDDHDNNNYSEHSEYSDDFEVDIPTSPTYKPSLPKVEHMGYTF